MSELPAITRSSYMNNTIDTARGGFPALNPFPSLPSAVDMLKQEEIRKFNKINVKEKNMPKKRLVQVFIADPDLKMPLRDSLIYKGETLLTDSDDEELFFDLPIKELLVKHNEKREKVIDKKATDRSLVQYLEPIRIRELKMTVVTLAEF